MLNHGFRNLFMLVMLLIFTLGDLAAQRNCGTMRHLEYQVQKDATNALKKWNMDRALAAYQRNAWEYKQDLTITIPVVVHVVYANTDQNLSETQICNQIQVLNDDYGRKNTDTSNTPVAFRSVAADTHIEFCLARRDPNGNATNGITRTSTSSGPFNDFQNDIKFDSTGGKDAWPRNDYLNIWVGNLQGNLLGYATFPGLGTANTDGVVIDFKYFGTGGTATSPYDLGRTTTHELGHWLGLYHIWGDDGGNCNGSDQVADTPEQGDSYYDCPVHPSVSCGTDDMFMNFLDYTDDVCMNLFTEGQKIRMRGTLENFRQSIKYSLGCVASNEPVYDAAILDLIFPSGDMCSNFFAPLVRFSNSGSHTIVNADFLYEVDNGAEGLQRWVGSLAPGNSRLIPLSPLTITDGSYQIDVEVRNPNYSGDVNPANNNITANFTVTGAGAGNAVLPFFEGFESVGLPAGWDTVNTNNDQAWTKSSTAGANGSVSSVVFDNFNGGVSAMGNKDDLITPKFNLSDDPWVSLSFYVAHAKRSNSEADTLVVYASLDCGNSWLELWRKGGDELSTATNTNSFFVPASQAEWREEIITLDFLDGNESVLFSFRNISDLGNAIYVDEINLNKAGVGIEEFADFEISIFPNPSDGLFSIQMDRSFNESVQIEVFDLLGKQVLKLKCSGSTIPRMIDLSHAKAGVYLCRVSFDTSGKLLKLIVE